MKKLIGVIAMALSFGTAGAAVTNLFPNGDFDSPAGTGSPWIEVFGGGTTTYSYPTTGGNPGGHGRMTNSSGWGIWVGQTSPTAGYSLASLGLVAGSNYNFVMDMKNFSGTGIGKLKIECWAGGVRIDEGPEISASGQSGAWVTYTFNRTLVPGTTSIMIVPIAGAGSAVGYDNIGVVVPTAVTNVSITSPINNSVVNPSFTINATASVLPGSVTNVAFFDGGTLLGNDPTAPYSFSYNGAALGAHALTAVARSSIGISVTSSVVTVTVTNAPTLPGWQLVWADEFTQPNGTSPDSGKWNYDIGTGCPGNCNWGNNELQYYTSRTNNVRIENDQLVIEAKAETYTGTDDITRNYTSARLKTQGKWSWTYGRMEARIKVPRTQGIWPAFWMLGANIPSVGWPTCGEIDIMEHIGREPKKVYGTIHGPGYSGGEGIGGSYTFGPDVADDFRVFAVEWGTNIIRWYVDGINYFTVTPASLGGDTWVFNQPQFFLLNVAVGGNWPGDPDGTTILPQKMLVDYVRVYTNVPAIPTAPATPTGFAASPGSAKVYLSWNSSAGATGYQVKRATSNGGPYTTVANLTANNFTDTGVANCATYYYVVAATNSVGTSTNSSQQTANLGTYALAVNSGGSAAGHFVADTNVTGGTIGATVANPIDTSGLVAPAPQIVYQAERYGNFTYTFVGLISGATYTVRLHSAETYWSGIGQRRFNVLINGAQVLTNFDIIAAAGAANKAVINEFSTVATGGQISVQYVTVTDNARASGIEIILTRPNSPTGLAATPTNSQVALKWNAIPGSTYSVKRASSGAGPFTPLATGLASTNYTDLAVTNGSSYHYVVSATRQSCESTNSLALSTTPACTPPPAPAASNNGPLYPGMTLQLSASSVPGATYAWSGPDNFSSTEQNPIRQTVNTSAAGTYSVSATVAGCISGVSTTLVSVLPPLRLNLAFSGGQLVLGWPAGTLQSATNLTGPWLNVPGAQSLWTNPMTAEREFFRIQLP
jgi:beta-glucanase (GH16 family)